jgi:hypothetical protein
MARRPISNLNNCPDRRTLSKVFLLSFIIVAPGVVFAEPSPAALSVFNNYVLTIESRLAQQHRSPQSFLASGSSSPQTLLRLRQGDLMIERFTPSNDSVFNGAMLHHWRGSAFVPGATVQAVERLMKDFNAYPQHFSPQVLKANVLAQQGSDHMQAVIRVRQRHVVTVVMDTTYDIEFGHLGPQHGYSMSRSTHISEIDSPGTSAERVLTASQEHGFLWRLNTYWTYVERDGGLYIEVESISLTRSIPDGLGWAIGPFVESVPRESLEFTLRSTCKALLQSERAQQ